MALKDAVSCSTSEPACVVGRRVAKSPPAIRAAVSETTTSGRTARRDTQTPPAAPATLVKRAAEAMTRRSTRRLCSSPLSCQTSKTRVSTAGMGMPTTKSRLVEFIRVSVVTWSLLTWRSAVSETIDGGRWALGVCHSPSMSSNKVEPADCSMELTTLLSVRGAVKMVLRIRAALT